MIPFLRRHQKSLGVLSVVLLAVAVGFALGSHFVLTAVGLVVLLIAVIAFGYPELAYIASLASIVLGQLIRIPVGSSEILPNDIIVPVLCVTWVLRRLVSGTWTLRRHSLSLPIFTMVLVMGLSLVVNANTVDRAELLGGSLYLVRWVEYVVLFWIGQDLVRTHSRARSYLLYTIAIGASIAILGFIQLQVFPDFSSMVPKGWDPHIGRLLSTWFDPNYLGGFFVLLLAAAIGYVFPQPFRPMRWWWAAIAIMLVATVLTFSRSAYVGLVVVLGVLGIVRYRAALFLGILGMIAVILFVPRVQERVIGIRSIDETAQLRLVSYSNALLVIQDHPVVGVGYNLYKYTQVKYNFLERTEEHSASGSDSSLLTIWVTTGMVGLLVYIWLLIAMLRELWKTWHDKTLPKEWQGFGLGAFAGMLGLIAHSQFVNGLHYPHLMEVMWLFVAIAISVRQPSTK